MKKSQPEDDLVTILTKVSYYVAVYKVSNVPDTYLHHMKQIPLRQDTLIRKIYLKQNEMEEKMNQTQNEVTSNTSNAQNLPTNISIDNQDRKHKEKCICMWKNGKLCFNYLVQCCQLWM